jgi:hypothetical protein
MTQLTNDDMNNLRHMLGIAVHIQKKKWGYRNRFAPAGANIQSMERLEMAGFVHKGNPYGDSYYFHATAEGCAAVGFTPIQTKRILNDQ